MLNREPILCLCKYFELRKGIKISDFDEEGLIQFWSDLFDNGTDSSAQKISESGGNWPYLFGDASLPTDGEKEMLESISRIDLVRSVYSFFEWRRSSLAGKSLFSQTDLGSILKSSKLCVKMDPKTPKKIHGTSEASCAMNEPLEAAIPRQKMSQRKKVTQSRLIYSPEMMLSVKKGKFALIQLHYKRKEWAACRRLFSEHFKWLSDPTIVPGIPASFCIQVRETFERLKTVMGPQRPISTRPSSEAKENVRPVGHVGTDKILARRRMCLKWLEFGSCSDEKACPLAHSLEQRFTS